MSLMSVRYYSINILLNNRNIEKKFLIITFKRLPLCSQSPKLQKFIIWQMISVRNLHGDKKNIW